MQLLPFAPSMGADLAHCYNDLIADVPNCHPVPVEQFGSMEALASTRRPAREEEIMVAEAEGEIAGFVHVGIAPPPEESWHPQGEPGVIRFLSYRPGQRPVGQALLDWAEGWARQRGRSAVVAWDMGFVYGFYHFQYAHLSERIGHVRALHGMAGYAENDSELFFTWRDFTPPAPVRPALDVEVTTDWKDGPYGPRVDISARRDGARIGFCRMDRGQPSPAPDALDWCFCDELDVEGPFQGQRLGHFLLSTGLNLMREAGCRHAAISTNGQNHRAALMYTNLGHRFADRTVSFRKELA
jgi:GNAT superfamily N-acetyltransferase